MDEQNKPNARKKRVVGAGKGIEKQGEGLGTGPVGQSEQRPSQSAFQNAQQTAQRPVQNTQNPQRPVQSSFQNAQRPAQNPFGQSSQNAQRPYRIPSVRAASGRNRPRSARTDRSPVPSGKRSGPSRRHNGLHRAAGRHMQPVLLQAVKAPDKPSEAAVSLPLAAEK